MLSLVGLILLISIALVYVFSAFPDDRFLMVIELSNYQLEIKSALVFSVLLLLTFVIIFVVYFIVKFILSYHNSNYRAIIRDHQKSQDILADFMKNLYLRDVNKTEKNIEQLKRYMNHKSYLYRFLDLQYLMISGDEKKVKSTLLAMHHDYPNDVFILNTLGLECYKQEDFKSSIIYLEQSSNLSFKSRNTIELLIRNYQICGEHRKLESLIKHAIRKKVISKNEYQKELALSYLMISRDYYQNNDLKNYHKYSDMAFDCYPEHQYILNNYIKSLELRQKSTKAINIIVKSWENYAHPRLREHIISLLEGKSHKYQFKIARELIKSNNYNVESFIVFAHFAKNNSELHDEVIKYLERGLSIAKIKEVVEFLIEIKSKYYPDTDNEIIKLKQLRDNIEIEYRHSCLNCHSSLDHWQLVCNKCHSIDQVELQLTNKHKVSLLEHF